jgi:hypothetical protein
MPPGVAGAKHIERDDGVFRSALVVGQSRPYSKRRRQRMRQRTAAAHPFGERAGPLLGVTGVPLMQFLELGQAQAEARMNDGGVYDAATGPPAGASTG